MKELLTKLVTFLVVPAFGYLFIGLAWGFVKWQPPLWWFEDWIPTLRGGYLGLCVGWWVFLIYILIEEHWK